MATKPASNAVKRAPTKRAAPAHSVGRQAAFAFEGHRSDAVGLMVLALGVVLALATWVHVAGGAGRAIDEVVDTVVGAVRYVAPIGLLAAGVALFASSSDDEKAKRQPARLAVGSALVLLAVCGLLELGGRGGALGWAAAVPLQNLVGSWATGTLLVAIGLVGVIVLTQTSVLATARRVGAGASAFGTARQSLVHTGIHGRQRNDERDSQALRPGRRRRPPRPA